MKSDTPPDWLLGAWRRESIIEGGTTTTNVAVFYLQTPKLFVDVRVPDDRPRLPHATKLADLTDDELRLLARQKGFAGTTTVAPAPRGPASSGATAQVTWHRALDFQPASPDPDVGNVFVDGRAMREIDPDNTYVENWWRLDAGTTGFFVATRRRGQRIDELFLVAGDHFMYVHNRAADLPPGGSLADLAATATREQLLAYLDCELSYGRVRGARRPWEIVVSTFPWREGTSLPIDVTGWTVELDTLAPADRKHLLE